MTIRTLLVSLSAATVALFASVACEIHTCEEGATCREDDWEGDNTRTECTSYCGRLSVCGAKQARDFEECVDSCRARYEKLPEETHRLCACAPASSCGDVIEGRCTSPGSSDGSGGSCSTCGSGGAPNGNPGGGGAAAGAPNASGGSSAGLGGSSASGGSGGSGTAGETGMSCVASCDCPSGQSCVSGYCTL